MTQKFHEGEEVEVVRIFKPDMTGGPVWAKGRIISFFLGDGFETYIVEFRTGVKVAFDSKQIRAVSP